MGAGLKEGEIVVIEGPDGRTEVGLIIEYHARGECELGLGLVWVQSGNFKQLANEFTDKLSGFRISRGETHSFITDECIARIVRQYDGNDKRSAKRPKTGLTVALPYVTAPDVSSFKGGHFHSNLELPRKFLTLHSVISALEKNDFIMSRKINQEFLSEIQLRKFLKDALKGRSEGVWMNPSVSQACLKFFGIPRAYFSQDRKLVSGYNQMIIQVDGTDTARTLGMHKDRDAADKEVNTVLGCVGGEGGKDVILWRACALSDMPRWWRNEGLGREAFRFALLQCRHIDVIRRSASVVTLEPGQFVFMPKGTWHWVCPTEGTRWTCMITSSFY